MKTQAGSVFAERLATLGGPGLSQGEIDAVRG